MRPKLERSMVRLPAVTDSRLVIEALAQGISLSEYLRGVLVRHAATLGPPTHLHLIPEIPEGDKQ